MSMRLAAILALAICLSGCTTDNDGLDDPIHFNGLWSVTYGCPANDDPDDDAGTFTMTITLSADGLTASGTGNDPVEGPFSFVGEVDGDTITWTRDFLYTEDDGGSQTTSYSLLDDATLWKASNGKDSSGAEQWTCNGTGTKQQ